MQILMIALCLTGFSEDGNINSGGISGWSPVDASITFNVLNTWTITWATQVLGLATWETGSQVNIIFSNSSGMEIGSLDPSTGGTAGSVSKPSGCGSGFGIAFNDNPTTPVWHINSWSYANLWYTEDNFSTWQTITNPSGTNGRGMTFDGTDYWQSSQTSLVRFQPGVGAETFTGVAPTQISGVAYVPGDNPSYDYIMITTYNTNTFILYSYDGTSLTQVATGTTPTGLGNTNRLGLTYSFDRGSLFFAYAISGGYAITEMEFDVVSLSRDTWAGIKSSF
ncbi:MAG: hypothetical protein R6V62_01995 [Candidatus Fermentibacteraceae bacterium]